ncbi:serine hydrolase [Sphingosinicella terrae]|jgi:beta-lactamase class A|uniref:serine hydrolase n=1 Tax=Sphingosinicella terrae TaxID=2172047 RepID=UPI002546AE9D|nr:serine hydrolase [Sphingosinicella terrae]
MRFVGLLAWLVAFSAQPALAQYAPPIQSLEQRLAALATENPGEYGIAALDLQTGAMVSFNGNEPFPMASTMKIAVAAAYLEEVDAGRRSLADEIGGVTVHSLMDSMITRSNNRATDILMNALGGPAAIDGWLRRHRLTGIRVDRTIAQLLADRRDLRDIRDSSTPEAMLGLLRLIASGDALSTNSRALLLDMMRRCATGSNRIRGLLPPGAQVAHKTGTLNGYTGDVGYFTTPEGRRIAVVFFARYGENRPAVISTAARAIYDAFDPRRQAGGLQGLQGLQGLGGRLTQASSGGEAGAASQPSQPSGACSLGGRPVAAQC